MSDLNGLAADRDCLCHDRICELGRSGALCKEGDAASVCHVHEPLCFVVSALEGGRIHDVIRSAGLCEFHALRNALENKELGNAGSLEELGGCKADRACAEDCCMPAGTDAAAVYEKAIVGDACRLDHGAHLESGHLVAAVVVHDIVELVAVLGFHRAVLRESAVIGQAGLFQFFTLVEVSS